MIMRLIRPTLKTLVILTLYLSQNIFLCQEVAAQENTQNTITDAGLPAGKTAQVNERERAAAPNKEKQNQRLLRSELIGHDVVTLSAMGEEFLGIWEQDSTGNPFGAAIVIHGAGQTADWPNTIASLRQELASHGWATLSVSLPDTTEPTVPPRTETPTSPITNAKSKAAVANEGASPSPSPSPANKKPAPPAAINPIAITKKDTKAEIEVKVNARLNAAIAFLNQQGQFNIVLIGNGLGAGRAARFIETLSNAGTSLSQNKKTNTGRNKAIIKRPIRALVMISARNTIPDSTKTLGELLSDPGLPVLDVIFNEHYLDELEASQRKQLARKMRLQYFFQVKLLAPTGELDASTNRLVRRVRGFLNRYAKGVEIGK